MTTAAYPDPGDEGDYQGHLVAIDLESGRQKVFNAACSDRVIHFVENGDENNDCAQVQAGIWARSGAVYDPVTDRVFVTTGNGVYDADNGGFNWGSSIVALRPDGSTDDGTPLDSYTPVDHQRLTDLDLDLSSTTVAILPLAEGSPLPRLGVQGGKDGLLRLVNLDDLSGQGGPRHLGGELQVLRVPQGGALMTRPATWVDASGTTWVFVATYRGLSALTLSIDENEQPQLVERWLRMVGGTTPIVVNGIVFCAHDHEIAALDASSGNVLWSDGSIGPVHWQSPIVVNGQLFICDNDGYISAYRLGEVR